MPSAATAATISVQETLALLDRSFATFAKGVAEDRYAFWLGSGISLGRVEGLKKVVARVMEFLRVRVTVDPDCPFKTALYDALGLASLTKDEEARVDIGQPFSDWLDAEAITGRLINNYAKLLETEVKGKPQDFLLWDAVAVVSTFANPTLEPDVEHVCLAILILEGVASDIASANWDGLIERAVSLLAPNHPILLVCIRPEDLREPELRGRLFKFHGCAVKAGEDEGTYRQHLVGRQSQILNWALRVENKPMLNSLINLATTKPTLMMGLSAQDANIQALFAEAKETMKWNWPGERPSYLFSNEQLGGDHKILLQNVYPAAYTAADRDKIKETALIRAYAKPLLVALVLHVICSKLTELLQFVPGSLGIADKGQLRQGILTLRDMMAAQAAADMPFIRFFLQQNGRTLSLFRDGVASTQAYNPISATPIQKLPADPGLSSSGLTEAAVAVGLLGLGAQTGDWSFNAENTSDPASGMIRINGATQSARLFIVRDSYIALKLGYNGHIVDADRTILIHSKEKATTSSRSPRKTPGRAGKIGLREVSISTLLKETGSVGELMQRFREEVAV